MTHFGQNNAVLQDIVSAGTKYYSKCYGFPATSMTNVVSWCGPREQATVHWLALQSWCFCLQLMKQPLRTCYADTWQWWFVKKRCHLTHLIWIRAGETWRHAHSLHWRGRCVTFHWIFSQLIKCACISTPPPCKTMTCTCRKSGLSCSMFCFFSATVAELWMCVGF